MFDWLAKSGSLKPSSVVPVLFALARLAGVTEPGPQIIGTNSARLPAPIVGPAAQL
jgi:hypothetical protein